MTQPEPRGGMTHALTEHPEGGLVADPWEGVTVRAAIRPRPTMPGWLIAARAPGWPMRRALLAEERRMMGATQVDLFETRPTTLTEALAAAGYTTAPSWGVGQRAVLRDGVPVFVGRVGEVWDWLRTEGATNGR